MFVFNPSGRRVGNLGGRRRLTLLGAAGALAVIGALGACDGGGSGGSAAQAPQISASQLQSAATEADVKAFYESRQWRAAWPKGADGKLVEALKGAPQHGLDPSEFFRIIDGAKGDAAREAALTLAALRYSKALASGVVDPKKVHDIYALDQPKVDLAAGLSQALQSGNVGEWLSSLAPKDDEYQALSKAYLTYRALADEGAKTPIPAGAEIRIGGQDPRMPLIVQRLAASGYVEAPADPGATTFTRQISEGVKSLQRDAEIPVTGRLDAATVAAVNQSAAERARQLAVNLERRRWLARELPPTRIDVNTASAQLVYFRQGQPAWTTRTVPGSPKNPTPALGAPFKQLVVNPPWNVPQGIAEEEIFPKGADYMSRNNMYVENGRVIQRPGPETALGAVKFDMQDKYAIYLHDTPAKALFSAPERHRSHGCVRVENAVQFARMLAEERGQAQAFDTALQSGETHTVSLGEEIPVRLLYHTAYVDDAGKLIFADDPYDWDDKLGQAMGLQPSNHHHGPAPAALLGP